MAEVLVVANETLGGRALIDAVKQRNERGDARFFVIAPMNEPRSGNIVYEESVRDAAQFRVDTTIAQLRQNGIQAEGEVMDPDPHSAVVDAMGIRAFDEIIISTHPATRSGWLRKDLIQRIRDTTGKPVTHVVVDLDQARHDAVHTLVVANQTVGGRELRDTLKRKAAEGPHVFVLIVPLPGGTGAATAPGRERVADFVADLGEQGIQVTGGVGDPDPYTAIMNALQFYDIDEIVISTLPQTRSGWLRSDLIDRVRRATATPVEHVVVDIEPARTGS
jgi:hypothetical protein